MIIVNFFYRDNNIAYNNPSNASSRCTSTIPPVSPINTRNALSPLPQSNTPCRCPSPLSYPPGPESFESVLAEPVNFLPHTSFPSLNGSGGYIPRPESCFSPMPTRDHLQEVEEETAAIVNQVSDVLARISYFCEIFRFHIPLLYNVFLESIARFKMSWNVRMNP